MFERTLDNLKANLSNLADVLDAAERGEFPEFELPEEGFSSSTDFAGDQMTITMTDGRIESLFIDSNWWRSVNPDDIEDVLRDALNAAITEHEQVTAAAVLEAGGVPSAMASIWHAQSYLTSDLLMDLENEAKAREGAL